MSETDTDPDRDMRAVRDGRFTAEQLLAACLEGVDPDREQGWREYVDTIVEAASRNQRIAWVQS